MAAEIQKLLPGLSSYYQMDGKAGVAAFYAELFRHTRQDAYLHQALVLIEDAASAYRNSGSRSNTLIEGSTGIAFSALAAYRSTGEKRFLEIAEQLAAEIGAPHDNEYAYGAAGIGIFMLNLAQVTGKTAWREKAVEMASYLHKAGRRDHRWRAYSPRSSRMSAGASRVTHRSLSHLESYSFSSGS